MHSPTLLLKHTCALSPNLRGELWNQWFPQSFRFAPLSNATWQTSKHIFVVGSYRGAVPNHRPWAAVCYDPAHERAARSPRSVAAVKSSWAQDLTTDGRSGRLGVKKRQTALGAWDDPPIWNGILNTTKFWNNQPDSCIEIIQNALNLQELEGQDRGCWGENSFELWLLLPGTSLIWFFTTSDCNSVKMEVRLNESVVIVDTLRIHTDQASVKRISAPE